MTVSLLYPPFSLGYARAGAGAEDDTTDAEPPAAAEECDQPSATEAPAQETATVDEVQVEAQEAVAEQAPAADDESVQS